MVDAAATAMLDVMCAQRACRTYTDEPGLTQLLGVPRRRPVAEIAHRNRFGAVFSAEGPTC